jgi:hypothetical protein
MPPENEKPLPCIEYHKIKADMTGTDDLFIFVRGESLGECRKHFEEIKAVSEEIKVVVK